MKKQFVAGFLLLATIGMKAQVSNTGFMDTAGGEKIGKLHIGAFMDMYYVHAPNNRPDLPYLYSSARANEMSINLAYIDLRFTDNNIRARLVPGFGTYMNRNYSAERGSLRNLVEASAGFRLFKKHEIWLDAGVIGSSYTNESAVSKDHLMYSRSLAAENSPYYQSGIKLSIPLINKVKIAIYGLNGWQQIQDLNKYKSLGTQVEWTINRNHLLNWDTYVGDERSTTNPNYRMRWFSDLYWIGKIGHKWNFTSCIFMGIQEVAWMSRIPPINISEETDWYPWWNANFVANYSFTKKTSISGRIEWFDDVANVMQKSLKPFQPNESYKTGSTGFCLNRKIQENMLLRLEYRRFFSRIILYPDQKNATYTTNKSWLYGSLAVWF